MRQIVAACIIDGNGPRVPREAWEGAMRATTNALAGAVVLAVIAYAAPGAFGADPPTLPLPEVTVTAPRLPTPSWKKWNPYSVNPRVEEDKWPDIPCTDSRIASGAATRCKTGPSLSHGGAGLTGGDKGPDLSNCRIAHDLVMTNVGNLTIEADVTVFDPYFVAANGPQNRGCYVQSLYGDLRDDFPDMNQMTREGSGWRNFLDSGELSTMDFSVGSRNCRAIEKRGPRWRAGYVYVINASVCRTDGRAVESTDIDYVLGSLQVRQYEPRGNLRPPPQ
jgi:hypothetical protein